MTINAALFFWLCVLAVFGLLCLGAGLTVIGFVLYQALKQDRELHKQNQEEYEGLKRSLLSFRFENGESGKQAKI